MRIARLLLFLLLATPALAQTLRWILPPLGAAEYRRTLRERSVTAETIDKAKSAAANEPVPPAYLPELAPGPLLCEGELDDDAQRVATPVRDLRDLLRAIAFDLGASGSSSWKFPRLVPFGDLSASGSVSPFDKNGAQRIELTLARKTATKLPDDPKSGRYEFEAMFAFDARGTIAMQRTVDAQRGLVTRFRATLTLFIHEDKKRVRRIEIEDEWELVAVRENQDADFRKRVAEAVRRGSAWVREQLADDAATWTRDKKDEAFTFGSGRLALAALTLLHSEVPPTDPVLAEALAAMQRRKMTDTYSLATALMALSQRYAPPRESEMVRSGSVARRAARELPQAERDLAQKWLGKLLENRDTRVDPERTLRFDYDGGKRFDNSVSQYGLLGLDAAQLCGLTISDATWAASADHFLSTQCPSRGPSDALALVTHRDLALAAGKDPEPRTVRIAPRGFAYQEPAEPPYGSLTAASLSGMIVARAGMLSIERAPKRRLKELDTAIDASFAWLAREFTVRANPGFVGKADKHWHYWLYSLERACELAGIAHLDGRDWYYEGALHLLAQQQKTGAFKAGSGETMAIEATCFAVLFLKKSTLPAITGK